jgi:CheY-like chemotaxis protein
LDRFHVLIVDDDKDIAGYFRVVLSLMGFDVEIALTAREALASLTASAPDLILLDLRLGRELGGEDILFQIRSNPRFEHTRVIVVTGYPNTTELVSELADLVLLKPVDMEQLQSLVTRVTTPGLEPKTLPFRDPITLLYTREFLFTRLELAFERGRRRPDFLYAVIAIQIVPVLPAGEELPAEAGLVMMGEVAARLKRWLRPTDSLSRTSGWRFTALIEDLHHPNDVDIVCSRLELVLAGPYTVGEEFYKVVPYTGAATRSPEFIQAEDILVAAERALELSLIRA